MNLGLISGSTFAPDVDSLFKYLLISTAVIVATVWFGIVYFCIRYRKGSSADRKNPPERSKSLEFGLMGLIFVFGLVIFFFSARTFYSMIRSPENAIEVDVVAKQWMWIFHDQQRDEINTLVVPVGRPIRLVMTSQDVIHSFFVPDFRIKQDVVPGTYTSIWFQAEKLGKYTILCTQFCGLSHSQMLGTIDVVTDEEYAKRDNNIPASSEFEHGRALFASKGCISCHGTDANTATKIGPRLDNLYNNSVQLADGSIVTADENYIRRAILNPNSEVVQGYTSTMPSFQGQISEEDMLALIRYIKALGKR